MLVLWYEKTLCSSPLAVLLSLCVISSPVLAQEQTAQELELISKTANEICQTIPLEYTYSGVQLTGDAKAKVGGLVGKFVDLGLSGTGESESTHTTGILEQDLVKAIGNSNDCKLSVFKTLERDLLRKPSPETQSVNSPSPTGEPAPPYALSMIVPKPNNQGARPGSPDLTPQPSTPPPEHSWLRGFDLHYGETLSEVKARYPRGTFDNTDYLRIKGLPREDAFYKLSLTLPQIAPDPLSFSGHFTLTGDVHHRNYTVDGFYFAKSYNEPCTALHPGQDAQKMVDWYSDSLGPPTKTRLNDGLYTGEWDWEFPGNKGPVGRQFSVTLWYAWGNGPRCELMIAGGA